MDDAAEANAAKATATEANAAAAADSAEANAAEAAGASEAAVAEGAGNAVTAAEAEGSANVPTAAEVEAVALWAAISIATRWRHLEDRVDFLLASLQLSPTGGHQWAGYHQARHQRRGHRWSEDEETDSDDA